MLYKDMLLSFTVFYLYMLNYNNFPFISSNHLITPIKVSPIRVSKGFFGSVYYIDTIIFCRVR